MFILHVRKDIFCTVYHLKKTQLSRVNLILSLHVNWSHYIYIANDFSLIKT